MNTKKIVTPPMWSDQWQELVIRFYPVWPEPMNNRISVRHANDMIMTLDAGAIKLILEVLTADGTTVKPF